MKNKEKWVKLLNGSRRRGSTATETEHRNNFDEDIDRIISSSSIRRLQDKAQVYPLQENDFTRTRLTHSLEVSGIARSLGSAISNYLVDIGDIEEKQVPKLQSLLYVAGLIHDLGNPPFGHFGEEIIKGYFKECFLKEEDKFAELSEIEKTDFINFDGNAQTLRIITRLQYLKDEFGINLTAGTLSSLIKYPYSSSECPKKNINEIYQKFGYFLDDKECYNWVRSETGLQGNARNPITYLLEAADDIAWIFSDIEDGIKKGLINWEQEYRVIRSRIKNKSFLELFKKINDVNKIYQSNEIKNKEQYCYMQFKIAIQSKMILDVIKTFKRNYADIMDNDKFSNLEKDGEYRSLIQVSDSRIMFDELKNILKKFCYPSREIVFLQLAASNVLTKLLDVFVNAVIKEDNIFDSDGKNMHQKTLLLISDNFKHVLKLSCEKVNEKPTKYQKLLLVTDFVSGMTDTYALTLYKKMVGDRIV